jgi:hypothetical protein
MAKVVADIRRRLLDPAVEVAKVRKAHADKIGAQKSDLASTAETLRKRFPGLTVRHDKDASQNGSIYRNDDSGSGPYLSGRFYNDGKVTIDQLGSLSSEQFERVMAALYENQ